MSYLISLVIVGTIVWMGCDSSVNEIPCTRSKPYSAWNGPVQWVLCAVLLWLVCFPWYLVLREKVMRDR